MQNFGKNLDQKLKETRITRVELAEAIGVTRTTIWNYINNKRRPDMETFAKIADFLKVELDYFRK